MENTMKERLLEILEELDPEVDYESCTTPSTPSP